MGKLLSWLIGIIIILLIIIFFVWKLLPTVVSSKLSEMTKVKVSIDYLGIFPKTIDVKKLSVRNPPGSILNYALKVDSIAAKVPFSHFFYQNIVIPELTLNDIYLDLEFNSLGSKKGNWTTIMKDLNHSLSSEEQQSQKEKKRTILIKTLILNHLDIDLVFRNNGEIKKLQPIQRLEFHNISSEGGFPTGQIMNLIMQEMLKEVFNINNLQNMIEGVLKEGSKGVLEQLKGFFSLQDEETFDWNHLIERLSEDCVNKKENELITLKTKRNY